MEAGSAGGNPSVVVEASASSPNVSKRLLDLVFQALPVIGGAIGFAGFVAIIGGAIQWVRFNEAGLPAVQAVHAIPQGELVVVGAQSLIVFTLLGVLAVVIVYLADPRGEGNLATARALLFVTVLECFVVLALVRESASTLIYSGLVVVALAVPIGLVIVPVVDLVRAWTGVSRLRAARQRWKEAAESARIERALASVPATSPTQADAAALRLATAERALLEAEVAWVRVVEELETVKSKALTNPNETPA